MEVIILTNRIHNQEIRRKHNENAKKTIWELKLLRNITKENKKHMPMSKFFILYINCYI